MENSENNAVIISPSQTDYISALEVNEVDGIYLDPLFLKLVDFCIKTVEFIDHILWFTKTVSYHIFSGLVCLVLLFYFTFNVLSSYAEVNISLPNFNYKLNMLQGILKYKINKSFLNDIRLCPAFNENYLNDRYASLIKFIDSEMIHFKIQNDKIESLIYHCLNLSIFIAVLPLVFKLPKWIKFSVLIAAFSSKCLMDRSMGFSLDMMILINVFWGLILLTIHYVNVRLSIDASLNK
jgi:hypothetical protein